MRGGGDVSLTYWIAASTVFSILTFTASAVSGSVVINEILYNSPGEDKGCFVELKGKPGLSLDDYFIVGINGNGGVEYNRIDLSGHSIPSNGYFLIAQDESIPEADLIDSKVDFQNGPDNIELWQGENKIDAVGYGDFSEAIFSGEGEPTLDLSNYSLGRKPDGSDTNDNCIDFVGLALTSPGKPNSPNLAVNKSEKLAYKWGLLKSSKLK
jgi:hypothetical protein